MHDSLSSNKRYEKWLRNIPKGAWRTRNGVITSIVEMETPHLENTLSMLYRWGMSHTDKFQEIFNERNRRRDNSRITLG